MLVTSLLLPVIYLTFVSLGLPDSLLGSAWPVMYPELSAPVAAQSALSMLISACTIVSSLATAKLVRRWGTGRLVATSVGLTAAAILGFSACKEFWQLVALAVPYGLGAGAIDSSLNNYVAIHYGPRHMSWLHCCWGIGTSVGPVAMGWALAGPMSWHGGYLVIGIAQAVITAVLFCSLPLWKRSAGEKDEGESASNGATEKPGYGALLRLPGAGVVIASFGCYSALESSCGLWIASLLVLARGVGEAQAASMVALFYLGITAGRFLAGVVADRIAGPQMIRIGQGVIALGIAALAAGGSDTAVLSIAIALIGLGCAPIYPSIVALTPSRFGEAASQGMVSLQMACAYVGSTFFPPVCALVVGTGGAALLPSLYAVVLAAMIALAELANRRCRAE